MIPLDVFIQIIGLICEIGGTIIFAESVFLNDDEIKKLSFHEMGGFDLHIQEQLKKDRFRGRIGLSILLIGLVFQGVSLIFS